MQEFIKNIKVWKDNIDNIADKEMRGIMKIVKSLEDSGSLIKRITEIETETKKQYGRFLGMLLGTLGASLLGNLLTGKK